MSEPEDESQAYFWTPEWQEQERQADRDFRAGDTFGPASADDVIRWLRSDERPSPEPLGER